MNRILRLWPFHLCLILAGSAVCAVASRAKPTEATASPYIVTPVAPLATAVPAPGDAGSVQVISQKGRAFQPATATVHLHRWITIKNDDDTVHHAYCSSPDFKYNSGPQDIGSVHNITFHNLGTFEIRCAIHPDMKLVVTVVK